MNYNLLLIVALFVTAENVTTAQDSVYRYVFEKHSKSALQDHTKFSFDVNSNDYYKTTAKAEAYGNNNN